MITVLGASGQLGSAFRELLGNARFLDRETLDLTAPNLAESLPPLDGPLINCAAWTAVDDAEDHEPEATAVNGRAVGVLARVARSQGAPFITYSTDYVFDGKATNPYDETADPHPVNAYGRSKLAGEQAALEHEGTLVIRTSWIQSGTHRCFLRSIIDLAESRPELAVVNDQFGRPTFADDLASATIEALEIGVTGLLHVANEGEATWYELASTLLRYAGSTTSIRPVSSLDFPTKAERPRYSVLDTSRMTDMGVSRLPHWQDSLRKVLPLLSPGLGVDGS